MPAVKTEPANTTSDTHSPFSVFFIVGAVRSGTTLLRLLMGHHPDISNCNEMEYVTPILLDRELRSSGYKAQQWLMLERQYRNSGYRFDPSQPVETELKNFFQQLYDAAPRPWVSATVHNQFHALPELFPNAKFIFIHRDPRDVARSCKQMGWNGTAWGASRFWRTGQAQLWQLKQRIKPEQIKEIQFEALIGDPTHTLTELCEFLNLTFTPHMLELEKDTTYSRPKKSEAASWREKASRRAIQEIESAIPIEEITAAGYASSGYPPYIPNKWQRILLVARDKWAKHQFALKRYGLLHIAGLLAARVPNHGFRLWVSVKKEVITRRYLK